MPSGGGILAGWLTTCRTRGWDDDGADPRDFGVVPDVVGLTTWEVPPAAPEAPGVNALDHH